MYNKRMNALTISYNIRSYRKCTKAVFTFVKLCCLINVGGKSSLRIKFLHTNIIMKTAINKMKKKLGVFRGLACIDTHHTYLEIVLLKDLV